MCPVHSCSSSIPTSISKSRQPDRHLTEPRTSISIWSRLARTKHLTEMNEKLTGNLLLAPRFLPQDQSQVKFYSLVTANCVKSFPAFVLRKEGRDGGVYTKMYRVRRRRRLRECVESHEVVMRGSRYIPLSLSLSLSLYARLHRPVCSARTVGGRGTPLTSGVTSIALQPIRFKATQSIMRNASSLMADECVAGSRSAALRGDGVGLTFVNQQLKVVRCPLFLSLSFSEQG